MGELYIWLNPTIIDTEQIAKVVLKRATGLSCFQPMHSLPAARNVQCDDSLHTENGNGNYVHYVISLYSVITVLYLHCGFRILLYHFSKLKSQIM